MMILLEHLAMMLLTGLKFSDRVFVFAQSLQSVQILPYLSNPTQMVHPRKLTAGYPKWWFGVPGDSEDSFPLKYGHFRYRHVGFLGCRLQWFWSWNLWKSQFQTGSVRVPKGIMAMEGVAARGITRDPKIVHQWLTIRCVSLHPGITVRPSGRAAKQLQEIISYRSTIQTIHTF